MNNISSTTELLRNTYSLVHLARETAIAHGRMEQAERLSPVVDDLKKIVDISKSPSPVATSTTAPSTAAVNQSDFQTLLKAVESSAKTGGEALSIKERTQVIQAMAAGGMQDIDIARQMGMTRDEVRTLIQLGNQTKNTAGRYE